MRELRRVLRLLLRRGVHLAIVAGADAESIDEQLRLRGRGEPGSLVFVTGAPNATGKQRAIRIWLRLPSSWMT